MKKFWIILLAAMPLGLWAQDNTWELPEEEQQVEETTLEAKINPNAKYLRGAVPEIDGKVVFSKTIEAPGKSAAQIYTILHDYMVKMTKASNQINSRVVVEDSVNHELGASFEEWLVFKKSALQLDKTRLYFVLEAKCENGKADVTMRRIHYLYDENRKPERFKAEGWITDDYAVNKKNTKLFPGSGKFRRKTIDRKDFIFDKFESLLK
jgi:colicin import membrane protein